MKYVMEQLKKDSRISDYRINIHGRESYELFFVKGKLETLRRTDTWDKEVTVYVNHGDYKGEAQFFIYPSTTEAQIDTFIEEAVQKALLIQNKNFELPAGEQGTFAVDSGFARGEVSDHAAAIHQAVFAALTAEDTALNSVEIFLNKHIRSVENSRGLKKEQVSYDAMVEAIPTYNGKEQSVELYLQHNFGNPDPEDITAKIAQGLKEVSDRYIATKPETIPACKVILQEQELAQLCWSIARGLNFATVFSGRNLFRKGDAIQKDPTGDKLTITMRGTIPGSIRSAAFDADGVALKEQTIVSEGVVSNYYGSNRYGQYLGETPTGDLPCLQVNPGSAKDGELKEGKWLSVVSMSGLQVDFYKDYIGGEVRLAYYHDGEKTLPVTGISISGKLSQVLSQIRLSGKTTVYNGYQGPEQAILQEMQIF